MHPALLVSAFQPRQAVFCLLFTHTQLVLPQDNTDDLMFPGVCSSNPESSTGNGMGLVWTKCPEKFQLHGRVHTLPCLASPHSGPLLSGDAATQKQLSASGSRCATSARRFSCISIPHTQLLNSILPGAASGHLAGLRLVPFLRYCL